MARRKCPGTSQRGKDRCKCGGEKKNVQKKSLTKKEMRHCEKSSDTGLLASSKDGGPVVDSKGVEPELERAKLERYRPRKRLENVRKGSGSRRSNARAESGTTGLPGPALQVSLPLGSGWGRSSSYLSGANAARWQNSHPERFPGEAYRSAQNDGLD